MNKVTFDSDTGEILADEKDGDKIKYVKSNSIRFMEINGITKDGKTERYIITGNKFCKIYTHAVKDVLCSLNVYEKSLLLTMCVYASYEDNRLVYTNGREIDFTALLEISGLCKSTLSQTIKSLCDKNVIKIEKNGRKNVYYMNPKYVTRGRGIKKRIKDKFSILLNE